jgi:hypothetical protein
VCPGATTSRRAQRISLRRQMSDPDLGRLFRLHGAVKAAADVTPDGQAAPVLTSSYLRLREQALELADDERRAELEATFPIMDALELPASTHPRFAVTLQATGGPAARTAQALLVQLAGWLDGYIAAMTLEQRMRLEAEERVKQERRRAPGFTGDS